MKTVAAFLVIVCLTISATKGQSRPSVQRCLCKGPGVKMVRPKLIEKIEIHPESQFCGRLEVVVRLKKGAGMRCLNTESLFTRTIIERIAKKTRSAQM